MTAPWRLASLAISIAVVASCGGSSSNVVCGEGTTKRGNRCTAASTSTSVTLQAAPSAESEVDAATMADFAAKMCECPDTTCAVDVSRRVSEWNRQRTIAPTSALQNSVRVYLACVAKLSATAVADRPASAEPPAVSPPEKRTPSAREVSIAAFKEEFRAVSTLVATLEARDADRAAEPLRLLRAVQTNFEMAMKDDDARERLMRMLAKVRSATQERLDRSR